MIKAKIILESAYESKLHLTKNGFLISSIKKTEKSELYNCSPKNIFIYNQNKIDLNDFPNNGKTIVQIYNPENKIFIDILVMTINLFEKYKNYHCVLMTSKEKCKNIQQIDDEFLQHYIDIVNSKNYKIDNISLIKNENNLFVIDSINFK